VGREGELSKLIAILDDYRKTSNLKNLILTGEKSIGKSSLLNRYKSILQYYNLVVYEVELHRDPNNEIDEFEFFKDLFNELFEQYAPPEGSFFDVQQSEIWFSLTSNTYSHDSNFKERILLFPTQYANKKRGIDEVLSYKSIEKDFEKILDELISTDIEIEGLAILIDEFQELTRNTKILDVLRQLTENLTGLLVIGAGLPTFLENPIFEKFCRISTPINLQKMKNQEVLDLIFRPLEFTTSMPRHEIQQWFDRNSIGEIVDRGGGNPLHVRILCGKMFDHFQSDDKLILFELNKSVMEEVMDYYSAISEKSKKIQRSLQTCRKDQLESFSLLYKYEGFSIRAAIMIEMAFHSMSAEEEHITRERILRFFQDIWDLELFVIKNEVLKWEEIYELSTDKLSQIEYSFIGDAIDKLYVTYYYEELVLKPLEHHGGMNFEDILAYKLAEHLTTFMFTKRIPKKVNALTGDPLVEIQNYHSDQMIEGKDLISDFDNIIKGSKESEKNEKQINELREIAERRKLNFPARIASMLELEGYYLLFANVTIKGKSKIIYSYTPIKGGIEDITVVNEQVKDVFVEQSILDQYMVKINYVYVYFIPKEPLLFITHIDLSEEYNELNTCVAKRNFDRAVSVADNIRQMNVKIRVKEKAVMGRINDANNYAFCLINIKSLEKAEEQLEECRNTMLISKINFAYCLFLAGKSPEARNILRHIVKKKNGIDEKAAFMHLAINETSLENKHRLIESVILFNVAAWNIALISCQEGRDPSATFSYLKQVKPKNDDHLIDRRVRNWISFFTGDLPLAINKASKLLSDCDEESYLSRDVERDLEIFRQRNI